MIDDIPTLTDEDNKPRILLACFECDTSKDVAFEGAEDFFVEADQRETFIDEV